MSSVPTFTLNNGVKIPAVGLGCWMGDSKSGEQTEEMVKLALKVGYRHLDTAFHYGNEAHVGNAIRASGVPRTEIFLTTKLACSDHDDVAKGCDTSLKALNCEYIDLYLIHWPQATLNGKTIQPEESPTILETWKQMEQLLDTGKVKSIGISNFSIKLLEEFLPHVNIVPAVNQLELHPALPSHDLLAYCRSKGIHATAYCPLGQYNSPFLKDAKMEEIAKSISEDTTSAQVVLSWAVQRGTSVVPKSSNEGRLKKNLELVKLSDSQMRAIDDWHKTGVHRSLCAYPEDKRGYVMEWTLEQLGWSLNDDMYVV